MLKLLIKKSIISNNKMGCCIKCCSDNILNIFVFLKPTPPSYDIEKISISEDKLKSNENSNSSLIVRKNKSSSVKTEEEVIFKSKTNSNDINKEKENNYKEIDLILRNKIYEGSVIELIKRNYPFLEVKCYNVNIDDSSYIIVIEIINRKNKKNETFNNLVFCHGNSTDLGLSFNTLIDLAYQSQCNVFSFDYRGYGKSAGVTNENNIYKDFETLINFITTIKPNYVPIERLVL